MSEGLSEDLLRRKRFATVEEMINATTEDPIVLLRKIKRRKTLPNVGDYVLAVRYRDADPQDPWAVGWVVEVKQLSPWSRRFRVVNVDPTVEWVEKELGVFPYAWKLSQEEGHEVYEYFAERQPYEWRRKNGLCE